jgi:16S rRNA (guanine966-N2)-methyltransferase
VVTLVEHDRRTAALIRDNAKQLGFRGVEVLASSVTSALTHPPRAPYDLVFIDPPYALEHSAVFDTLTRLRGNGWLAEAALLVVERASRDPVLEWPDGYAPLRSKKYGETTLWYGHATTPHA